MTCIEFEFDCLTNQTQRVIASITCDVKEDNFTAYIAGLRGRLMRSSRARQGPDIPSSS